MVDYSTSEEGKLKDFLMFLTNMKRLHIRQNLAIMILATLISYNICNNLSYLVMDNFSLNNILTDYISITFTSDRILYDEWYYQLYFKTHIINLAV